MGDLQTMLMVIAGSIGIGLVTETVRATIWAAMFAVFFRRLRKGSR
jgi:hypothetical protein